MNDELKALYSELAQLQDEKRKKQCDKERKRGEYSKRYLRKIHETDHGVVFRFRPYIEAYDTDTLLDYFLTLETERNVKIVCVERFEKSNIIYCRKNKRG